MILEGISPPPTSEDPKSKPSTETFGSSPTAAPHLYVPAAFLSHSQLP